MFHWDEIDFIEAKKNLNRQATKVLHDIVDAYQRGVFDDPTASSYFCSLLACICEGKVEGVLDKESMQVRWSLTEEFSSQLELQREKAHKDNVVAGPW